MAVQRLQKELRLLAKDPLPSITARPDVKNILVWHYVLEGDAASEYAGGVYHGKITFPSQYPFRPPAIVMVTPSGRFQSNTRLCLSMSDYHRVLEPELVRGQHLDRPPEFLLRKHRDDRKRVVFRARATRACRGVRGVQREEPRVPKGLPRLDFRARWFRERHRGTARRNGAAEKRGDDGGAFRGRRAAIRRARLVFFFRRRRALRRRRRARRRETMTRRRRVIRTYIDETYVTTKYGTVHRLNSGKNT